MEIMEKVGQDLRVEEEILLISIKGYHHTFRLRLNTENGHNIHNFQ